MQRRDRLGQRAGQFHHVVSLAKREVVCEHIPSYRRDGGGPDPHRRLNPMVGNRLVRYDVAAGAFHSLARQILSSGVHRGILLHQGEGP